MTDESRYRNVGAPWTRADGTRVRRNDVLAPTADELLRRAHKLRPTRDPVTVATPDVAVVAQAEEAEAFPDGLDATEFTKLDHRRAAAVVEGLPDGDERLEEYFAAEAARERGPRDSVLAAFAARGVVGPQAEAELAE